MKMEQPELPNPGKKKEEEIYVMWRLKFPCWYMTHDKKEWVFQTVWEIIVSAVNSELLK